MNRRHCLRNLGLGLSSLPFLSTQGLTAIPLTSIEGRPEDELYWNDFAKQHYTVSPDFINLENGYFGVQPNTVLQAYKENIDRVNAYSSKFMRQDFYKKNFPEVKKALARISGAREE